MENNHLKNCPFCGGNYLHPYIVGYIKMVECKRCEAKAPMSIWNTRCKESSPDRNCDKDWFAETC